MGLTRYAAKRDFKKTDEPGPVVKHSRGGNSYLIQKHDASRLHYDFRLELDGVLKSWAVPKGPSIDPADKRLAVEVEDHPLDYGTFEGTIPKGEYGGGTVMLWDRGTWEPLDPDPRAALKKGRLHLALHGEKLQGEWTLSRMARREGEEKNNWLLIKRNDKYAKPGRGDSILEKKDTSIKTGRAMEEIAGATGKGGAKVWKSGRERKVAASKRAPATRPSARARAKPSKEGSPVDEIPSDLSLQLCTLAGAIPPGDQWLHEIKLDGYRLLAVKLGDQVRLITRSGLDWTHKFKPIAEAVARIKVRTVVLDGEAAVTDARGKTSFQLLQRALKSQGLDDLAFFVFDLLAVDGEDLRALPLTERKARLAEVVEAVVSKKGEGVVRLNEFIEGHGADVQQQACRLGLEGMVSKLKNSIYEGGRTRMWLKVKCGHRQEFIVVGWTDPGRSSKEGVRGRGRGHFGSLLLAAHDDRGRLVYTGKVGTGFDNAGLRDMLARLKPLAVKAHPLDADAPRSEVGGAHWVKPKVVVEVAFTEWTDDGRLRHPSFQGVREDKAAAAVKIEKEQPVSALGKTASARSVKNASTSPPTPGLVTDEADPKPAKAPTRRPSPAKRPAGSKAGAESEASVAGVRISNPQRVVYPDAGVTKLGVAEYFESVADWMLPYVADRPLSVVRCTGGLAGACFFQKHPGDTFGPPVKAVPVRESEGVANYIAVSSTKALVSLVQMGVLEVHPWGSKAKTLEKPDLVVFDLDPAPRLPFERVKEAAFRIREVLEGMGVKSWLKTSGGKGLHVVIPLKTSLKVTWELTKNFAEQVAKGLSAAEPDRYLAKASKAERKGKVFIDWLRNGRGATSVAPYSPRARAAAGVSMPLRWEDLDGLKSADQFTILNTLDHIKSRKRDPWADYTPVDVSRLLSGSEKKRR